MFHCNGWAYPWAVTATGARHLCLAEIDAAEIWRMLLREGGTHLCAAPTLITMLVGAPEAAPTPEPVQVFVGGAPPAPSLLERAAALNLHVTHLYGLTESYGPIAVCAWNPDWDDLSGTQQARLRARQGVGHRGERADARRRRRDARRRRDGEALGEVVLRGDNVMTGYYRDPEATAEAFRGGWFHTGDLGVMHPDGYVELRDRLKDIVISGGENIADDRGRAGARRAPVGRGGRGRRRAGRAVGRVPIAFVTAARRRGDRRRTSSSRSRASASRASRCPSGSSCLDELPKTEHGQDPEVRAAREGERRAALEVRRMKSVLAEFREFVLRGNLVDLAIAVVLGAAFGALVTSFVTNLVTPLIAAIGGQPDFSDLHLHDQQLAVPLRRVPQRAAVVPDHRRGDLLPRRQAGERAAGAQQGRRRARARVADPGRHAADRDPRPAARGEPGLAPALADGDVGRHAAGGVPGLQADEQVAAGAPEADPEGEGLAGRDLR